MLKDNEAGARAVLAKLTTAEEGEKEIADIKASLAEHHSGRLLSFGALLIFIGIMLSVFQQFVASTSCSIMPRKFSRTWALTPMPRCSRPSSLARST